MPIKPALKRFVVSLPLTLTSILGNAENLISIPTAEGCHVQVLINITEQFQWSGSCVNGFTSGTGTLIQKLRNGHTVSQTGTMVNGLFEGPATEVFDNGGKVTGTFLHGHITEGEVTAPNGTIYSGHFGNRGLPNGFGTLTLTDGQKFSGNWTNGALYNQKGELLIQFPAKAGATAKKRTP